MNPKTRTGILGGSFDPIHNGHLIAAQAIMRSLNLDNMILVPAYRSPFKNTHCASAIDRLNMVKLAIAGNPLFTVCDYEISQKNTSYTVDTLHFLHNTHPDTDFYLIIGNDSLTGLPNWHKAEVLASLCTIIVVSRPPYNNTLQANQFSIQRIETPLIEISSTSIRDLVAKKYDIIYLVPESVKDYILTNKLYQ